MEAVIQEFAKSIQSFTKNQLFDLCLQQKRDICALEAGLKAYRDTDTAMARDHQSALQKIKELEVQVKELQCALDHVRANNELLNRHRFGSHNEKIEALHSSFGEEIEDPISEDQDPDQPASRNKVVRFSQKPKTEEEKKKAQEDRKARAAARKAAAQALGNARTKTAPTKMDTSGLPHTNTYDLDLEKWDALCGEDNWEIIGWHKKEYLRRPITTCYVETVFSPVIRFRDTGKLLAQPMPDVLMKGSPVTSELLAAILYEKYFKSIPLYRQSADLANLGLILPRQDMSNWIIRFSNEYFAAPYYYMQKLQRACTYGQSDESTLQVLHEEGRDARTKSFVWVHTTGELDDQVHPIVVFAYEPTRNTEHLRHYYAGFSGIISCDAYGAYGLLAKESGGRIRISGCLMHARRRFAEALEVIKLGKLSKEQIEELPEYRALILLGNIYHAEGALKTLDAQDRFAHRQTEVKPLMDEFFTWLESFDLADPLLSGKMKDAISYSLNQKENLCRFLEDGRVPCDNGFAENSIRLYAQGRRNWLFSNTPQGAMSSAMVYSLIETARRNQANPLLYMKYLLEKTSTYLDLPSGSTQLEELMPWSEKYKKYEEDEKKKAMEFHMAHSQEKPSYRPSRKRKGKSKDSSLPAAV